MSETDYDYSAISHLVQFGPVYHCWVCGSPARRIVPWTEWVPGKTLMDEVAEHIGYLDLPETCREAHHPCRVAIVGPAVTPLDLSADSVAERHAAVRAAIAHLTKALQEHKAEDSLDQALSVALRLYAQVTPPSQGAQEIRALAGHQAFAGA